jgi:ABC-type amino acid transport substrate-binding protein
MNFNIKTLLAIFITVIITGIFVYKKQKVTPTNTQQNILTVGMISGWAPFMSISPQGEYEGFDVAIAQELGKNLNKKVIIQDYGNVAALLLALKQKKIDCALSGFDITRERLQQFDFVPYTGESIRSFYILFWEKIPQNVVSLKTLIQNYKNPIICAEAGSAQAQYLNTISGIDIKYLSNIDAMVLDVQYGKSCALIIEPQIMRRLIKQVPQLKALEIPLPGTYCTYGLGIACTKNSSLTKLIIRSIQELKNDGSIQALEQKWGLIYV